MMHSTKRRDGTILIARYRMLRPWCYVVAGIFASQVLAAETVNVQEIVQRSERALRGRTEQGTVSMMVRTPDWQRTLDMNYWAVDPDKTFIRVTAPAKEAGTATLRLKNNMWNYLPSVERTIKIPPSLMLQPWLGSDFSNDDLVRETSLVTDYDPVYAGEETIGGDACYRAVLTPKPDAPVVWGKLILLIRKQDLLPRREEYYDDKGKLLKVLTFDDFRKTDGRVYPMRWRMESVTKRGHETVLIYRNLVFDRTISASVFTRENLQQPY